ncbi:uncharacterized protein LOC143253420 isoform X2 [Tachypleus tridentatus]|uniref:uncharacterized protein LOC143253420 isoform X2 n=1 Tax=Tachypleus tridentatus TaxID=6853 RepID=UPI003FD08E7E
MEDDSKQRFKHFRRHERAARPQRHQLAGSQGRDPSGSLEPSPTPQKTTRKKRNKEPIFQEDVIDGFAILSFKTLEDLENTILKQENEKKANMAGSPDLDTKTKSKSDCDNSDVNIKLGNLNNKWNNNYWDSTATKPDTPLAHLTSPINTSDHRTNSSPTYSNRQTLNTHLEHIPVPVSGVLQTRPKLTEERSNVPISRIPPVEEINKTNTIAPKSYKKESSDILVCDPPTLLQPDISTECKISHVRDQTTRLQTLQGSGCQNLLDQAIPSPPLQNCDPLSGKDNSLDVSCTSISSKFVETIQQKLGSLNALHTGITPEPVKNRKSKSDSFNLLIPTLSSQSVKTFNEKHSPHDSLCSTTLSHCVKHLEHKSSSFGVSESRIQAHPIEKIKQKRIGVVDPTIRSQTVRNDLQNSGPLNGVSPIKQYHSSQKGDKKEVSHNLLDSKEQFNSIQKCEKEPVVLYSKGPLAGIPLATFRSKSENSNYLRKRSSVCIAPSSTVTSVKTTFSGSSVLQNRHPHLPPVGCVAPNPRNSASIQKPLRNNTATPEHLRTGVVASSLKNIDSSTYVPNYTSETLPAYNEHPSINSGAEKNKDYPINNSVTSASFYSFTTSAEHHRKSSSPSTLYKSNIPPVPSSSRLALAFTTPSSSVVSSRCSPGVITAKRHQPPSNHHSLKQESISDQRSNPDYRSSPPATKRDFFNGQLSNSLNSLSQASREGRKESHTSVVSSNSFKHSTPPCPTTCFVNNSLTNLTFSKSNTWTVGNLLGESGLPRPIPTPLSTSVPIQNLDHPSPFGTHRTMFAPAIHPAVSLPSTGLSLGVTAGPSPFTADSLFSHPSQDFLRRELDTRFLASHDRSINIPPPPYMRSEFHHHQHQHTHMHQHSSFIQPSFLPQPTTPLMNKYDKFPKMEPPFCGRSSLGLSNSYPGISPLLGSGATSFAPPSHIPTFLPKKSGRWCAMHVRIAWEIYNHQHHTSTGKSPTDILRSPSHLFSSLARPQEFSPFASPILPSSVSSHGRASFEGSYTNSFLSSAPHLGGVSPFVRPSYPGYLSSPSSSYPEVGPLGLGGGSGMLGSRELASSGLSAMVGQDPWNRLHRNSHSFVPLQPGVSRTSHAPWGGLKAEAEQEEGRIQREERGLDEERERERHRRTETEKDRKEKETLEKNKEKQQRERKNDEWQKERDREKRAFHHLHNMEGTTNGEYCDRNTHKERDSRQTRESREVSRSPVRHSRHDIKHENVIENQLVLTKSDVKVKEEKREEDLLRVSNSGLINSIVSEREHAKSMEASRLQKSNDYLPPSVPNHPHFMTRSHTIEPSSGSSLKHLQHSLTSSSRPTVALSSNGPIDSRDPYRLFDYPPVSGCDHEQIFDRYSSLHSVMPLPPYDRFREAEHPRQLFSLRDPDVAVQAERDRQLSEHGKLHPSILRHSDSSFLYASHGLPPFLPPGSIYPPPNSHFLSNLNNSVSTTRIKNNSPGNPTSSIPPPPLIPCSNTGAAVGNGVVHSQRSSRDPSPLINSKLANNQVSLMDNSHKTFFGKEKCELQSQPTEVNSQSR